MSSSDGEGPGQKPKPPASSTLAGMPPGKDGPPGPSRSPLPPPKAPPGGRPHSPSTAPPPRREGSAVTPLPQPSGPTPLGGSPALPQSGPYAAPQSGPHAMPGPNPQSGPHAAPQSGSHAVPQSGSHAVPQTTPQSGLHTMPAPGPQSGSFAAPQSGPFAAPQSGPFGAPQHTAPLAFPPAPPAPFAQHAAAQHQPAFVTASGAGGGTQHGLGALGPHDSVEDVPGSLFVKFLKISSRRAFRLRIEASEILPTERAALERAQPPILDATLQAFLAWRRSVLFLVAVALVPLSIIGLVDAMAGSMPTAIRLVKLGPALAEGLFCWICWTQLKHWSNWRKQRRLLFWGWLLFMAMPFVVFLYPLRSVVVETVSTPVDAFRGLGVSGTYQRAVQPFVFAMIAMLQLAPKAISLMPGLIRASLVIKLLFPGSVAPGWLIIMCSPLYALLAYVVLIVPYQFTGSGWFIAGVLGLIAGQIVLARAGLTLTRPLLEEEALARIRRVRTAYLTVMILSAVLIIFALWDLVKRLDMRVTDIITAIMKFETNVLCLTMIGSDLVITNLDRARSHTVGKGHVEEQAEVKIAAFVSLDAPATPPPPGPAF